MSNWWTQWAQRIALILADVWARSRAEDAKGRGAGGAAAGDRSVQPNPNGSDAARAPDPQAPQ